MQNDFESAVCTFLLSRSEITSVVGQNVFPEEAYQGAPYTTLTYQLMDDEQIHNLRGDDNLVWCWFQFVIYTQTPSDRRKLQDALRNILSGKLNTALTYTGGSVILSSAWLMNGGKDSYYNPPDGTEQGIYERRMTFRMCFHQTIPTL